MQKEYDKNEVVAALLAATIPAAMYCLYIIFSKALSLWEVIWTLTIVFSFSYFFVFSIGWWGYRKILKKRNIISLFAYLVFGVIVGLCVYLVFYLPVIIQNLGFGFESAYLVITNSYKLLIIFSIYGFLASAIFWFQAIRGK